MSIWNSTVSRNRLVRKLTEFMTQITRTNFALVSQPTVFTLNLSWFPSASVFNWVVSTIFRCCKQSGKMGIIKDLTPDLDKDNIEKHIARAVFGQFLYGFRILSDGNNTIDGYEAQSKLSDLSKERTVKVLTGTAEILKMFTVVVIPLEIKIPTISGTGNVKNKRDIFAGKLIINIRPSDKINEFISNMKSGPYGKYFHDTKTLNDATRLNYEDDFNFLSMLADSNVLSKNGKLEMDFIKYDPDYSNTAPLLSYFGYKLSKSKKIYEYTMLDTGLTIFTIAACQIFNFIPSDKTEHGCSNKSIDLDYLKEKNYRVSSKDFSNDILPKLYVVDEIDPSSLRESKMDVYSDSSNKDLKDYINHVPYLNSIHKNVISFIFCGLSLDMDINPEDYGKGFNSPPNPKGPNGSNNPDGKPKGDNPSIDDKGRGPTGSPGDSTPGKFEVSNPEVLIQDDTTEEPMDSLVLKQTSNGNFGLFRSLGGIAVKGVSILAPNVGTALTVGEKVLNLYYQSKPKPNIMVDNRSLIGQMNNEFSVVPNVPLLSNRRR